ncbi:uncharacterized protein LOC120012535 [Tripterygium wilfordii]|uniref:uncharacterized protein LOC120012535 n=1 Tax=Tripterygium wilfordii TaxID=458696 RepID=UPI0018F83887|nr:uncharacterized protein LOC120012535 [Tripterygium wilfordii]
MSGQSSGGSQGGRGSQQGPRVCFRCGQAGHVRHQCTTSGPECFECGKIGHMRVDYPQRRRDTQQRYGVSSAASTPTTPRAPSVSSGGSVGRGRSQTKTQQQQSQIQPALTQGRVFALGHQTGSKHPNFVGGTFLVLNCLVRVLFDSGATASFITASLAKSIELEVSPIRRMFAVTSPFGYTTSLEGMVEGVVCRFGEIELTADLYVLNFKDFDVILGVD